jgi:hypothetical protein
LRRLGETLPEKLGDEEWENEVARNILTLYVHTVRIGPIIIIMIVIIIINHEPKSWCQTYKEQAGGRGVGERGGEEYPDPLRAHGKGLIIIISSSSIIINRTS